MCKSAAQGPAKPTSSSSSSSIQDDEDDDVEAPRQRATIGRWSHQSIMPCSWFRHSGRYSFIHSLHSGALFLMVFVVIEAIIRNMHSIFMFVIFSCVLRFSASPLCQLLLLLWHPRHPVHPLSCFHFPAPLSHSLCLCPFLGPLLMAKTFNMRI